MANIQNPLELNPTVGGKQYAAGISKTKMQSLVDEVNKVGDKYEKPSGGIPSSDLSSSVQASLAKADASVSRQEFESTIESVYEDIHEEYGDPTRLNQLEDWGDIDDEATLRSRLRNVSDLSQAHTQRISFTVGDKTGFAIVTYNGEEFYVEYTLGSNRYACKQDANESGGWTPWLGSTELETYKHLDELDTRCDKQEADILLLDERKADVEGSYESMAVGSAKTLEADTLTAVDFTKRVVPSSVGSGASKLSLLKGNTLVWNQMIPIFSNSVTEEVVNGVTWSYDSNTGLFTFQGTCTKTSNYGAKFRMPMTEIFAEHKYLIFNAGRDGGNTPSLRLVVGDVIVPPGSYYQRNTIITVSQYKRSSNYLYIWFRNGETYNGSCYFNVFDLTRMFGEGNEPSSVAEFEALFPRENYAYATPWLMNFQGTGLKSTGSDFEQTLPLNVTTLKGKEEGSSTEVVMFPDGLKKAGNIYDEIDFANGIAIKRVGYTNLGDYDWNDYDYTEGSSTFPWGYAGSKNIYGKKAGVNAIDSKYNKNMLNFNDSDKCIVHHRTNNSIYIVDSSFIGMTGAQIKAALSDVILYYELATPIVYHFEPMNNVYRVEQGGTEEVENRDTVTPEGYAPLTAPLRADIRYGVDVVGILGNLKKDYVSKESIEVFLSALGTQMGGTWSMTWNETTERYDFAFTPNA